MSDPSAPVAATARMVGVTLDCRDPQALADFYVGLTGADVVHRTDDVVVLGTGDVMLGFQRVADHEPPSWPGPDKQLHVDFTVPDPQAAADQVVALGGTIPDFQPGDGTWTVLLDPAGHPFCLSAG